MNINVLNEDQLSILRSFDFSDKDIEEMNFSQIINFLYKSKSEITYCSCCGAASNKIHDKECIWND